MISDNTILFMSIQTHSAQVLGQAAAGRIDFQPSLIRVYFVWLEFWEPTFVEYGAADLGIAGKDVLLEHGAESLYEPLDLNIACCRLMTAAHKNAPEQRGRIRVATKYVKIARSYFASQGIQAEIIKLYGSMELAPLVGLADCIVDLVDTGNTLRANDLEPRELIMNISSRLVVNKAAMKMKHEAIAELLAQF